MSSSESICGARGAISIPVKAMEVKPRRAKYRWHITLQIPDPHPTSKTRFGGFLSKAGEHIGPLKTWHKSMVRRVCLWISRRSQGSGYGIIGSRRYRRPCRSVNGFARDVSVGASRVAVVRPLEPVVLDMLLERPCGSPLETEGRSPEPFLRSPLFPECEEDARCDLALWAAALALLVWFAACL